MEAQPKIEHWNVELAPYQYQHKALQANQLLWQAKPKPAAQPTPEQRLAELEKKLNALVKETEALRRAMQPHKSGDK